MARTGDLLPPLPDEVTYDSSGSGMLALNRILPLDSAKAASRSRTAPDGLEAQRERCVGTV
jgi:hypothetical protein